MNEIEQILELARWAPSGDNTQPWRFELISESKVVVHGFDTRAHCVYDLDGRASQIALGALLETLCIAATGARLRTEIRRLSDEPDEKPTFEISFAPEPALSPSPLIPCITTRAVQRRHLSPKPLTSEQKALIEDRVGPDHEIVWFETLDERWRVTKLMFLNAKLRLTMPEAFEVHRNVIEWNARFSEDKIPEQAVGVDRTTGKLMRWAMQSWSRVNFLNTWLGGTLVPRLQLDLIPGLACAAHFALEAKSPPSAIDDYVLAGRAMQRGWLEATRLGLWLQPEMTPVIFGRYQREGTYFTSSRSASALARKVAAQFEFIIGAEAARRLMFFARIGHGNAPRARSTRKPLSSLMWAPPAEDLNSAGRKRQLR
jgi:hypothetical protein